jgi:hypothetical protein
VTVNRSILTDLALALPFVLLLALGTRRGAAKSPPGVLA